MDKSVVDIEKCALSALEEDALFFLTKPHGAIARCWGVWLETTRGLENALHCALDGEWGCTERLESALLFLIACCSCSAKRFTFKILPIRRPTRSTLSPYAGPSAHSGADPVLSLERLARGVDRLVVGEHHVGCVADVQSPGGSMPDFFKPSISSTGRWDRSRHRCRSRRWCVFEECRRG
ncbi:MAG: hypothetical protein Ct9H300mP7_5890 [Verrucomicrobiota bacterium]|nr:MAG: hypothetical protein Ct9H300mP7_5890 [Verrucomicrobiota bacterium]